MNGEDRNNQRLHNLIESGADIAGGAVGGALGFLSAEPIGVAASFSKVI